MDAIEFSIQEHITKFKVEFESNDEKIHITLEKVEDRIACVGYFRITREPQAALDVTKISTYFLIDTARCYKTLIQELKRILLQTQKRHMEYRQTVMNSTFHNWWVLFSVDILRQTSVCFQARRLYSRSIQKHMSKYELEFLEDDHRLRVSVPLDVIREDSEEKFYRIGEISDAMRKAKLSTFSRVDSMKDLEKQIWIAQTRISGFEKRNASTTQERKELKVAQDMLRIHEGPMERQKRIHEEWKS
ncbi:hypothetical protein FDENT_5848 [Fusarium denticulatum]|uniref:Uncharacterized protein n=1 Tax=Fusarium denticulatum TaxID=48507 RepID=A0A8H5X3W4_9HYPO|nr:hypothetical protein FDENT_5848 [Fusarium denticulatum]